MSYFGQLNVPRFEIPDYAEMQAREQQIKMQKEALAGQRADREFQMQERQARAAAATAAAEKEARRADAVRRAMSGDPAAMADVAVYDPEFYGAESRRRTEKEKSDRDFQTKERETQGKMIYGVLSGIESDTGYQTAIDVLKRNGVDTSGLPEKFGPEVGLIHKGVGREIYGDKMTPDEERALKAYESSLKIGEISAQGNETRKTESVKAANSMREVVYKEGQANARNASDNATSSANAQLRVGQTQAAASSGKPVKTTEDERKSAYNVKRLQSALSEMDRVISANKKAQSPTAFSEAARKVGGDTVANLVTPKDRQRVYAAQRDALDAALTLATGAAYTGVQLDGQMVSFFPQVGDKPETVAAKDRRFRELIEAAKIRAGNALPQTSPATPTSKPAAASQGVVKWGKDKNGKPVRLP